MPIREVIVAALHERFGDRMWGAATPPGSIAAFRAIHPEVGDVIVRDTSHFGAIVGVGQILDADFHNFDSHLEENERAKRLAKDVVRFLQELFADRLLLWRSTDGRSAGWRERGDAGYSEPLVLDNRTYQRYLWSGPLTAWQAVPAILARGRIADEREHEIVAILLEEGGPVPLNEAERDLVGRLAADYRRTHAV
jgi:hypothetical protein